jgi:hypothetical protein
MTTRSEDQKLIANLHMAKVTIQVGLNWNTTEAAIATINEAIERIEKLATDARSWEGAAHEYEEQIRFLKAKYEAD